MDEQSRREVPLERGSAGDELSKQLKRMSPNKKTSLIRKMTRMTLGKPPHGSVKAARYDDIIAKAKAKADKARRAKR